MSKIITSFDIGIKNLAYCIMSYDPTRPSGDQLIIYDWNVINLLKDYTKDDKKCSVCKKAAYYQYNDDNLCKVHSRSHDKSQLKRLCTVDNTSLCELACMAVSKLDAIDFSKSNEVIFESQPSKNPKMKNLSMMLFNYFIIRYMAEKPADQRVLTDVKFVSSKHKLSVYDGPYVQCNLKNQYGRNKFYGKIYCRHMIRNNPTRVAFLDSFKKRDDLCDSFLQGAWYLMDTYKPPKINVSNVCPCAGKKILIKMRHTNANVQIMHDTHLNKYKLVKRGRKPPENTSKYTLANIKYLVKHNLLDMNQPEIAASIEYYFGPSFDVNQLHV